MWIFTTHGFLSVVRYRDDNPETLPPTFLVRFRSKKAADQIADMVKAQDRARGRPEVIELPDADYRFRIILTDLELDDLVRELTSGIEYDNFKNAAKAADPDIRLSVALARVWDAMWHYQETLIEYGPDVGGPVLD